MGLGSLILGILSILLMVAAILAVFVPFLGTMLSVLAPILALAGIVLGGTAMSRAKRGEDENETLATVGLVLNVIAFIPGLLVALTCGLCNTICTGTFLSNLSGDTRTSVPWDRDGGVNDPVADLFRAPDAAIPTPSIELVAPRDPDPTLDRLGDDTPLPPPPLPPGPPGSATPGGATPPPAPELRAVPEPEATEPAAPADPAPPPSGRRRSR